MPSGRYIRMRIVLASLLVMAACSKPQNYPAPLYAGLFVKGARHTYTIEAAKSWRDDEDPRADANGNVEERFTSTRTCTVTEVRRLPSAIASSIECQDTGPDPMVGDGPDGIYVATAKGLWRVPMMPKAAPTTAEYLLFTSPPVASAIDEPDAHNPGWGSRTTVSENGAGGWCRYVTFISGDDGDQEICVARGIIVSGSGSSAGGSSYEMSYTLRNE